MHEGTRSEPPASGTTAALRLRLPFQLEDESSAAWAERALADAFCQEEGYSRSWMAWPGHGSPFCLLHFATAEQAMAAAGSVCARLKEIDIGGGLGTVSIRKTDMEVLRRKEECRQVLPKGPSEDPSQCEAVARDDLTADEGQEEIELERKRKSEGKEKRQVALKRRRGRRKATTEEEEPVTRKADPRGWALANLTQGHRDKLLELKERLLELMHELHLHGIDDDKVSLAHLPQIFRERYSVTLKPSDYGFFRLKHVLLEFGDVLEVDNKKNVKLVQQTCRDTDPCMKELAFDEDRQPSPSNLNDPGTTPHRSFDMLQEHQDDLDNLGDTLPYLMDHEVLGNSPLHPCFVDSLGHETQEAGKRSLEAASPGSFTRVQEEEELEHGRMLTNEELHPLPEVPHDSPCRVISQCRKYLTSSSEGTHKVTDLGQHEPKDRTAQDNAIASDYFSTGKEWFVRSHEDGQAPLSVWNLFLMVQSGELSEDSVVAHSEKGFVVRVRDLFSPYQEESCRASTTYTENPQNVHECVVETEMLLDGDSLCDLTVWHMSGINKPIVGFPRFLELKRQGTLFIADGIAELFRGATRKEILENALVLHAVGHSNASDARRFKSFTQQLADIRRGHTFKYTVYSAENSAVGFILLLCPLIPEFIGPCNSPRQIDLSEQTAWKLGFLDWSLRSLRQPFLIAFQLPFWEGLVMNGMGKEETLVGRLSATGPIGVHMLPNKITIQSFVSEKNLLQPIGALLSEGSGSFILHGVRPPDVEALHHFLEEEQGPHSRVFISKPDTCIRGMDHILFMPLVRSNGKNIMCGCWCRKVGKNFSISKV